MSKTLIAAVLLLVVGCSGNVNNPVGHSGDHRIDGIVVHITDGDTLKVSGHDPDAKQYYGLIEYKIRLAEIDAPEKNQAYGEEATAALSEKTYGKRVIVYWKKKDRYERVVGYVYLKEEYVEGQYVNRSMVADGLAWYYKQYARTDELASVQADAKSNKLGLWQDNKPTPPWEFRKVKK